jgi:arylsulfatase A-like enzyme/predicted Zn-dependent protease
LTAVRRLGFSAFVLALAPLAVWLGVTHGWIPGGIRRPNLLLISIDTLRADRLGSYGYTAADTPVLDALASRGWRFTQATTVTPLTLPAHASLLTGTFPPSHGVRDNGGFYLHDREVTIAESLRNEGYRTGAFVGAFVLDSRWGLAQGFDRYFDDFDLSRYDMSVGLDAAQRPAEEVVGHAMEWLAADRTQPFLAWVHLYDPHTPYAAPPAIRHRFPFTMSGAYDAEVAATDRQIGRLLNSLGEHGRLDDTFVIVVADHGESLGEHDELTHGFFVYDATLHVPLIIAGPGLSRQVIASQVRIVDVMPTALELLSVANPKTVQGASLVPLTRGAPLELLAYSENWYPRYHYGWAELTAVRDGRFKFIAAPRRELYDTSIDPGETRDLSAANPRLADSLERALGEFTTRITATSEPVAPVPVDPDVEERLRALGYVGAGVTRRSLAERPRGDPKDKIGLYSLLKLAATDSVAGRVDQAIARVRQTLETDPEIVEAHVMLGNMLAKTARPEDAIVAYRQALTLDPDHEGAAFSLALAYRDAGRPGDAETGFERVLAMNPRNTKARFQLAGLWMERKAFDRAGRILQDALALDVERPAFLVKLGECYLETGRLTEAERTFRAALAEKPDQVLAQYDLGLVFESRGLLADAVKAYRAELVVSPRMYQAHFNLAKLLSKAGEPAEALAHYREAVSVNPEFSGGQLYLAKALLDAGDLEGAERAAQQGLSQKPDRIIAPLGHYVLADVYSRRGLEADSARQAALGRRLEGAAPRSAVSSSTPRSP